MSKGHPFAGQRVVLAPLATTKRQFAKLTKTIFFPDGRVRFKGRSPDGRRIQETVKP